MFHEGHEAAYLLRLHVDDAAQDGGALHSSNFGQLQGRAHGLTASGGQQYVSQKRCLLLPLVFEAALLASVRRKSQVKGQ